MTSGAGSLAARVVPALRLLVKSSRFARPHALARAHRRSAFVHGRREAGGHHPRRPPRPHRPHLAVGGAVHRRRPPRRGGGHARRAGRRDEWRREWYRRRRGGCGGGGGGGRGRPARGEEAVGAADVPGGGDDVQPRVHVHGRRRRLLPLRLANGGRRRSSGDGDGWHVRAIGGRGGRDGVVGEVGAPGSVARVAVAHARVAPPPARRSIRAQRRLRHRQRRPGHLPPRLRPPQPRPPPWPLLRRGAWDYAVRDGVHVRARRPGPPALPRGAHRGRALLPASGCSPPDTPHGQVRRRALRLIPRTQGAGGGGWDGGAGEGDQEEDQKEGGHGRHQMRVRVLHMP
uniref:Uncharacterized protein n=1 Tax=Oryza punctata TaxID=4537 RepID=A0A0E0MA38_ORYPU